MEPNRGSAIIKIDKVPFKVVVSTIRSKSVNGKINTSESVNFSYFIFLFYRYLLVATYFGNNNNNNHCTYNII